MFKIRTSTKIFFGFILVSAGAYEAYNKIQDVMIMGQKFAPIAPKRVNIVGITPVGYKVIIANEVAQLVETQGDFREGNSNADDSTDSDSAVKKKISIKDMLGCLQGNQKSLSAFLTSMNDFSENDLPPVRVLWSKSDLEKALNHDPILAKKLESDLNMHLDGTPLPTVNFHSLQNGIVLEVPVPVHLQIAGQLQTVVGTILIGYKPRMIRGVDADLAQEQGQITNTTVVGYYKQEAEKTLAGGKGLGKEDIAATLKDFISDARAADYAKYPEELLRTAFVVVNSDYITSADYTTYTSQNGKPLYNLHINLNDEGRRRLWQYTRRRVGDQILLCSDGVGIAAARIQQPLAFGQVEITHMTDQNLLDDLVANIKAEASSTVARQ
jgi:hypothetical protein